MKSTMHWLVLSVFALSCLLVAQTAQATHTNVYNEAGSLINTTDYSSVATGPNDGYWFPNFDAPANTGSTTPTNEAANLPSWIDLDRDSSSVDYSFGGVEALTTGGQSDYNMITLPGALSEKRSGEVQNTESSGGTDNFVSMTVLTAMKSASVYVVIDNAAANAVNYSPTNDRLIFRARHADDLGDIAVDAKQGGTNAGAANNGTADAYRWDLTNLAVGDILKIRLKGQVGNGGIGGIMFEGVPVPEPTSAMLLLGGLGLLSLAVRRRRG